MGDAIFSRGQLLANGRYRIERLLGEGGMGTVYQATELNLERTVALKVLLPELSQHPTARQRMEAEAKAMARIRSPHVVGINTISDEGGLLVIDLEYMSGGSLADRLDGRGVDEATAKDWITQILKGLEALHKAGLVHRDLKPANVLIDEHGALKVTDLGIAQDSQRSSGFKTRHDANLGTAEYMAPEQVQSAATVDARADVYAAGIMLYEFLVGHVPFQGEDWEVKAAQVRDTPDLTVVQRRSATLTHVLDTALAKEPERRFRTAGDMAKALVEPPESPARSSGNRSYTTASNNDMPERRPRFKMPMAAAVGAAVAVLAAGVGVWALQGGSEERAAQAEALEPDSAPTATTARLAGAGGPDSTGAAVAQINQADAAQTEPGTQPNTEQVRPLGQGALGDTGATSTENPKFAMGSTAARSHAILGR